MKSIGEAIKETVSTWTPSHSEYICPICEKVVPKMTVTILGMEKIVQPNCRCEIEAEIEQPIREAAARQRKDEIRRKFSISNLGARFQECLFTNFTDRPGAERASELARDYAYSFPRYAEQSLLIWGEPGNGKSHLAAGVCHYIKNKGYIPVFQSVPDLLERIRQTFRRDTKESEQEIMSALLDCDLLVLDDVGAEKVSDWVHDVLFRIVDGRYRMKRPIMYTSNLKPSELQDKLGKRICDRMMETSRIVENKATSYRLEVARERIKSET